MPERDDHPIGVDRHASREQRRRVRGYAQELAFGWRQDHRFQGLLGLGDRAAVVVLEDAVEGAVLEIDLGQPREQGGRQVRGVQHHRLSIPDAEALDEDDRVAGQARQVGRQLSAGFDGLDLDDTGRHRHAACRHGIADGEDAGDGELHAGSGDERAPALVAADESAFLEFSEGLAQRGPRDAEILAQLAFWRKAVPLVPFARSDQLLRSAGDDRVERFSGHGRTSTRTRIVAEVV